MAEDKENGTRKSEAQLDSEHFSPYRADGKLYGFICVVTGATQPIGKAIVAELAAHGAACIYACSHQPSPSSPAINAAFPNTKVIPYPYAIDSEQDTLALIDDVLNTWGRLDVWTSSTLLPSPPTITSTSPHDVLATFQANALPAFLALKYAPAAMHKTAPKGTYPNAAPKDVAYGSVVVVTSVAGTYAGSPAFTMASHAALGLVRSGVAVLKGSRVRINAVVAGHVESEEMVPRATLQSNGLERAGRPEEVARAVGFLASGFSSYVTGAELRVDGGAGVMDTIMVPV